MRLAKCLLRSNFNVFSRVFPSYHLSVCFAVQNPFEIYEKPILQSVKVGFAEKKLNQVKFLRMNTVAFFNQRQVIIRLIKCYVLLICSCLFLNNLQITFRRFTVR